MTPALTMSLLGRRVVHQDDRSRAAFVVHDVVFDQKVGRWLLLVSDVENGRITIWNANEAALLPEEQPR